MRVQAHLEDHSDEAEKEMASALRRGLEKAALQAESYAKLELENDPRRIDTGRLRDSISHKVVDDKTAYIGTNVEYAIYVHEGTDRMRPNRFLRNAVEKNQDELRKIIKEG